MVTQTETQPKISQDVLDYINSNPTVYDLYFKGYDNSRIVYTEPSDYAIQRALKDLELFKQRQQAMDDRTKISEGDWIIRKDGKYEGISVAHEGHVQAGGFGCVYVAKNGYTSYSGGCGDVIKSFELTNEVKKRRCWIFSNDSPGAGRGVFNFLSFKVWREL